MNFHGIKTPFNKNRAIWNFCRLLSRSRLSSVKWHRVRFQSAAEYEETLAKAAGFLAALNLSEAGVRAGAPAKA
jgi:hypothetical protein